MYRDNRIFFYCIRPLSSLINARHRSHIRALFGYRNTAFNRSSHISRHFNAIATNCVGNSVSGIQRKFALVHTRDFRKSSREYLISYIPDTLS